MAKADKAIPKEYKNLIEEISKHNQSYYVQDRPEIYDAEYDKLYDRLLEIESQYPELVSEKSPSQQVGATPSKRFPPLTHRVPMLSLQKVTTYDEFLEFDNGQKICLRQMKMLNISPSQS